MSKNKKLQDEKKRRFLNIILIIIISIVILAILINPASALSIENIEDFTINEEQSLSFSIFINDNNGTVTFSKTPNKGILTKIDDLEANFEWTPQIGDNGTYYFTFTANDNIETKNETNRIIVLKKNIPPVVTSTYVGNSNVENVQIDITTNTQTNCKYSLTNENYANMKYSFTNSNTEKTSHTAKTPALTQGTHTIYILCQDINGNYMTTPEKVQINVNLRPKVQISLSPNSPLREGTIEVELTTSEDLVSAPDLKYSYDDDSALKNIALIGSGKNWNGYLIIKDTESERVGSFIFKGIDLTNLEGTEIENGKIFLVDTLNPQAIQSINVENQNERIKLEWESENSNFDNIAEYKIYRREKSGGVEKIDYLATTKDNTYFDRDVEYNEAYYYKVLAIDRAGNEGALSKEVFITHIPIISSNSVNSDETNTELSASKDSELNSKLQYLLTLEVQKADKVLMDISKAEETLSRSLGTDTIEAIEQTKVLNILNQNKNSIISLKTKLEDLKNQNLDETTFNAKTSEIISQINSIWSNTPIEIKITDSATYQEFTDDDKTVAIINSYLAEYYLDLSTKDLIRASESAKSLQGEIIVNVKIIQGEIKYPNENKPFASVKKTYTSTSTNPLEKMLLFESIPTKLGNTKSIEFSEQPFFREDHVFWKIDNLIDKEINYVIYSNVNIADLKTVKSIIFDESDLLEKSSNLVTGQAVGEGIKPQGGVMLTLIIIGVLVVCGLFAYYVFWSESDDNNKKHSNNLQVQNIQSSANAQSLHIENAINTKNTPNNSTTKEKLTFNVANTLFKKKRDSIIPEDTHKKIELDKIDESIHTQSDSIEFDRVLREKIAEKTTENRFDTKNFEELDKLQEKLEELKKSSKVNDLEDFDALRAKTYDIKRLCEEIEEQSVIEFSNKTRAHLEKSLLYIAKNMPPDRKSPLKIQNNENNEINTAIDFDTQIHKSQTELTNNDKTTINNNHIVKEKIAPEWNEFVLSNGERIKSITELKTKIATMTDATFNSHVSENKNDFANWLRDVFQEFELAHRVRNAKTKDEIIAVL